MEDRICWEGGGTPPHCAVVLGCAAALEGCSCQIALEEGRICWEGASILLWSALGQRVDVLEEHSYLLMLVEDMTC